MSVRHWVCGTKSQIFAQYRAEEAKEVDCKGRGFVYIIEPDNERVFKIGFTTSNPLARLSSLQTGNYHQLRIVATIMGAPLLERIAHWSLASIRLTNEWFQGKGIVDDIAREVRTVDRKCNDPDELARRHSLGIPFYLPEAARARQVALDMLESEFLA